MSQRSAAGRRELGATGALTARMRHLVIEGPQLVDLPWTPGQQVRVHVLDLLSPTTWTRLGEALRT